MNEKSTTSGLGPDKIKELFRVCSEGDQAREQVDTKQQRAELLNDRLAERLPVPAAEHSHLRNAWDSLCKMSGINLGESIRTLLKRPETNLAVLENIKDYTRQISEKSSSDVELDVAKTLYYAAIAAALVYHDVRITKFSYKELEQSYSVFGGKDWISDDLITLFKKAHKACQGKTQNGEPHHAQTTR